MRIEIHHRKRPQDCGPVKRFRVRDARGTLYRQDRCARCGRGLPPLSRSEVEMMRHGLALLARTRKPHPIRIPPPAAIGQAPTPFVR